MDPDATAEAEEALLGLGASLEPEHESPDLAALPSPRFPRPAGSAKPAAGRLDVIVVTHESLADLERNFDALARAVEPLNGRVLVVDNASTDGSAEWVHRRDRPNVQVMSLSENIGYGAAANLAAGCSSAEVLLILNPDVEVPSSLALRRILHHLEEHPDAAAVAPRLLDPDGSVQGSARSAPSLPVLLARQTALGRTAVGRRLTASYVEPPQVSGTHAPVDWALGAALAVRATDFRRIGGFDERFFLYFEDVDLCVRLRSRGREVHYLPTTGLVHAHRRQSSREHGSALRSRLRREHVRSAARFFAKHPHYVLGPGPGAAISATGAATRRTFDLAASAVLLTVLAPLLLAVALAVRFDSRGDVLFRQRRVGRHGEPFTVLKFRTMVAGAESLESSPRVKRHVTGHPLAIGPDGRPVFKCLPAEQVTRVGAVLRRWSLDELPQLLNVFRGEMSLVGFRPPMPSEVAHYPDWYFGRFVVKPGLTGVWQVSGRCEKSYADMVRYDIEYAKRRSWLLDLRLLAKTVPAVLRRRGAL